MNLVLHEQGSEQGVRVFSHFRVEYDVKDYQKC